MVSYGGGTDSTALVVEAMSRGIVPDAVVFSDTGSEMPHTYSYLEEFDAWLKARGHAGIIVTRWLRKDGRFQSLHEWCLEHKSLPSRAFGLSGCTAKWKGYPLDKTIAGLEVVSAAHAAGVHVERWVGYDATEAHRVANLLGKPDPHLWRWRAPLYEWDIAREDCRDIIAKAGLSQPGKSSCFICPSMRPREIKALREQYPESYAVAIQVERGAQAGLTDVVGLGRNYRWEDLEKQVELPFAAHIDLPCGCHERRARPMWRRRAYAPVAGARLDPWRDVIGVWSDGRVAREAGVSVATVGKMRARMEARAWPSLLIGGPREGGAT